MKFLSNALITLAGLAAFADANRGRAAEESSPRRSLPGYGDGTGGYGGKKAGYDADGSYGGKKAGYEAADGSYGGKKAGYEAADGSYGGKKAGYDADGAYAGKKAGYDADGAYAGKKAGYEFDGYGGKKAGYEFDGYGGKKGGYDPCEGKGKGKGGGKKAGYDFDGGDYGGKKTGGYDFDGYGGKKAGYDFDGYGGKKGSVECPEPPPTTIPCIEANFVCQGDTPTVAVSYNYVDDCNTPDADPFGCTPMPSDFIGLYPCEEKDDGFKNEPATWVYTCYERNCRRDDPSTASDSGTFIMSDDTLPEFSTQGIYSNLETISETAPGCYIPLLNRIDGFSPPPYYNICEGTSIEITPCSS